MESIIPVLLVLGIVLGFLSSEICQGLTQSLELAVKNKKASKGVSGQTSG